MVGWSSIAFEHFLFLLEVAFIDLADATRAGARRFPDLLDELEVLAFAAVSLHVARHDLLDLKFLLSVATSSTVHLAEDSLDLVDVRVLFELGLVEHGVGP